MTKNILLIILSITSLYLYYKLWNWGSTSSNCFKSGVGHGVALMECQKEGANKEDCEYMKKLYYIDRKSCVGN